MPDQPLSFVGQLRLVVAPAFAMAVLLLAIGTGSAVAQGVSPFVSDPAVTDIRRTVRWSSTWSVFPDDGFTGSAVSTARFDLSRPSPVLRLVETKPVGAALLENRLLPDPYHGTGLFKWPGAYGNQRVRGDKLDFAPLTAEQRKANPWWRHRDNPFSRTWWYRRVFEIGIDEFTRLVWLDVEALNYTATIWLNGQRIYGPVSGPYRRHPILLPEGVLRPGDNVLAVEMQHPGREELGHSWIDWIATPPDKMLGMRREPSLFSTGPGRLRNTYVHTRTINADGSADLELITTVKGDGPISGTLVLRMADRSGDFTREIRHPFRTHDGSETIIVSGKPSLRIAHPKLWWPHNLGSPSLYDYSVQIEVDGVLSDAVRGRFGIRKVTAQLDKGRRRFFINGEPVFVNGVAWSGDMLHHEPDQKKRRKLIYVRHMGYNAIRQEGTLEGDNFYDMTDELGILVLGGYACCSHWESETGGERVRVEGGRRTQLWVWNDQKYEIARDSLWSQLLKLAKHPSFFAWFNGSDFPPKNRRVEQDYLPIYRSVFRVPASDGIGALHQVIPFASSFKRNSLFGPSGTKMSGPYEHVPPVYWYMTGARHTAGGAFGFNTEHGPGITIDGARSLAVMDTNLDLAPDSRDLPFGSCRGRPTLKSFALQQRSGTPVFAGGRPFFEALCRRYGPIRTMGDFLRRAQFQNYEDHRALNEAHGRNKHRSAFGHIYWMGMNGWPSLRWHLFDYHLRTGGTFYGAMKGNAPIGVQISYDDDSLWLVNRTADAASGLWLEMNAFDRSHRQVYRRRFDGLTAPANGATPLNAQLPFVDILERVRSAASTRDADTLYVVLRLYDAAGPLAHNFYWLSRKRDVLESRRPDRRAWAYAKIRSPARFSDLARTSNPPPIVESVTTFQPNLRESHGDPDLTGFVIDVQNPSANTLALFWKITPVPINGRENEVRFQLWSDNFVTLLPGESRKLTVMLDKKWSGKVRFEPTRY